MSYSICCVNWELAAPLLKSVREQVFVCEYRIPKQIEFDQKDPRSYHVLVCDDISEEPIATGRISAKGEISRIAVLPSFRHHQLDKIIIKSLIKIAKNLQLTEIYITSPLESVQHFINNDFKYAGSVFMEAGIPRQRLVCTLNNLTEHKLYLSH